MTEATLVFPNQLFKNNPATKAGRVVYLVEEFLFFRHYRFHQQKLILHRSGMKFYADFLATKKLSVTYIEARDERSDVRKLLSSLARHGVTKIHLTDTVDQWLTARIKASCEEHSINLMIYPSPAFLTTADEVTHYATNRKRYFQTEFYIEQRKKLDILLEASGKPVGGKWSYDADNRKKYPKSEKPPSLPARKEEPYLSAARAYVKENFADHYGHADGPHLFVSSFSAAEKWLDDFIVTRFSQFGEYEDAIVASESVLHHSVLSPLLNTGLLTPQQVVDATLKGAAKNKIPLNSLEGFLRQIIGWREFIRIVYEREATPQRTTNFWGFTRKIPPSFWNGSTGIPPIDITIHKILRTGYCHHIERLMVLGNFMLLCEFDPDEVYRWFMEMFIDSYDWVMVPNVYGMTQFADGGLMTTKPYISGSNYLMKMSDYPKGDWQKIWDGLFWRFMDCHRSFFLKNPRLGMLVNTFDKMDEQKRAAHSRIAEKYLASL